MDILVFSLGEKGFGVVRALVESVGARSIVCVIGQDAAVVDDCSARLNAYCVEHGIRHASRASARFDEGTFDLVFAVGWRWLIQGIPEEKLIVFHDALLPRYRGFAPLVNALLNEEKTVGVTALLGAKEYDRGNILLQKRMDVAYPTTIAREIERMSVLYAELATDLVEGIARGALDRGGTPQVEEDATYSLWRDDEDYRIDWSHGARDIAHFIDCVGHPYLGASAMLGATLVRIDAAEVRPDVTIENRVGGKVIFVEAGIPIVVCGQGLLALTEVRDDNGRSLLPLKSFRSRFR